MDRIRILAGDCAPRVPLVTDELWIWDGRVALKPAIKKNGWYRNSGTCTLNIPHGSKITGMTIRGRVAHYDALFSVYIVRVPNGSHPNDWFSKQYTLDEIVKWLHLTPSLNNGYIHHVATRDDINHTIDLTNNSYMIRMEMHINRDTVTPGFSDAYLTDIEIRFETPKTIRPVSIKESNISKIKAKGKERKFRKVKIKLASVT